MQTSLRNQILARYPSKEVRVLARMVADDPRSTTCRNLRYLREVTNMDNVESYSSWRVRESLPVQNVPEKEMWRVGLLNSLMGLRSEKYKRIQDTKHICAMIDSLCST